MFIDTHAHLTDKRFDPDRAETVKRANAAGVLKIIEVACEPQYWQQALRLSETNEGIYCALGLHPQEAKLCTEVLFKELENFLEHPKAIAVGETGFDYYHENSPRNVQRDVFEKHIELSVKTGKPLVIHCRDAYPDLIAVLKDKPCKGVIHCFSGTVKDAKQLLEMGFYLGIDGPVTYPKAESFRELVKMVPTERILLETDSPYLPPQPYRGKRNEPSYVLLVAEEIAKIKALPLPDIKRITTANAVALFGL